METLVPPPGASKPPSGKRMKARAPPPPNQPSAASRIHTELKSPAETAVISDQNLVSLKENMINRSVDFTVILPNGVEQKSTVQGSKAVMDLLVDLCSHYHLNPSQHSLELKSSGTQQPLSYKPNTLMGALDVQTVLLKEKVPEEKTKRPLPRVPEKSVRLVVNYLKTQKAVVRVSPEVPLHNIIPAICEKCEVSQEHVVLLRDGITGEELELTKSLEELGIKELYAWDRKREPSQKASISNEAIEKEKTRLLGLFKADRRNSKTEEYLMVDRDCGEEDVFSSTSEGSLDVLIFRCYEAQDGCVQHQNVLYPLSSRRTLPLSLLFSSILLTTDVDLGLNIHLLQSKMLC